MKKILFSLVVLSFLIGGCIVLAQDNNLPSPGITPDNPFYFLKTWKETIQNFFTFGAENKAKQFLHLADVRLAEYQKMIDKGKNEIAQKTLEKYEKQLNHALQKIEELKNKGKDIKDVSQKLENTVGKHIEVLEKNLEKVPEAGKKGIERALEASRKGIEKFQERTEKELACINSGGKISTSSCCKATDNFPNTCLIGACGCSPENSHEIKICDCGTDKCFNGEKCVVKEAAEDETANWKTYRNEEYGFEIKYPSDFNLDDLGFTELVQGVKKDPYNIAFGEGENPRDYIFSIYSKAGASAFQWAENVNLKNKIITPITINGIDAVKVSGRDINGNEGVFFYIIKENKTYILVYSYNPGNYEDVEKSQLGKEYFNKMISTFKFLE